MNLSSFGATGASPLRKVAVLMAVITLLGCLLVGTAFAASIFADSMCASCRGNN
jgi:hypothetical protein